MLVAATATVSQRMRRDRRRLTLIAGVGILAGAGLTMLYVDLIVIGLHPWYDPRYLIPLFGMIVSNAMNGAALAAERLASEIEARRAEIEAYLALGASPAYATRTASRLALTASLIPAINGLMIVGLVSLPGMMTGQILAGQSPLLAVRYQILVAFMLTGAVALTSVIVVRWYRTTFFTPAEQLAERVPV
jgi:putative ABC transport system permease protein